MALYSPNEREILARLAEAMVPAGRVVPGGGAATVERFERYMERLPKWAQASAKPTVWSLELGAIPMAGRRFSKLSIEQRRRVLERWRDSPIPSVRHGLRALAAGIKGCHYADPGIHRAMGLPEPEAPAQEEHPRWLAQVMDGREVREDSELEVDVVIVGSGAGGASLAYELALRGHAVLMIEAGQYFRRQDFQGSASERTTKLYLESGMTFALGNVAAAVWAGQTVGGTTTINSGTCYRTPERTFRMWRDRFGLEMFSSESMDAYYARVERILGVDHARKEYLGEVANVVARGAEKLGWVHGPLRRNAPDCDGQGLCCFGCPTGAKRSADVSYVPMALERGAACYASTRVEKILVESGEARGVEARCAGGGKLTVRAKMTVVSGGSLMTPVLLLGQHGLANSSGMVGKNLSIHPAGTVLALFDERIEGWRGIPQGYSIEQFAEEGLMLEGASVPFEITAIALPFWGPRFAEVMERYPHVASFGYMIQDTSRGRVRRAPGGHPVLTYWMNDGDVQRIKRCVEANARMFLAAGARSVFPAVRGFDEIRGESDLERFRRAKVRATDLEITAYHPLGTCRMGMDPKTSVVGPDHQTHDVKGLYVVDGSAIPSSLGVNPQLTIMAMATRAAEIMDRRLSGATEGRGDGRAHAGAVATGGPGAAGPGVWA